MDINNILKSEEENLNNKNSSEQIKRLYIPYTDFQIVGTDETGYFIALGKYKLTEDYPQFEDENLSDTGARLLEHCKWQIIINLIAISTEWAKIDTLNHLEKYGVPGLAQTNKT